MIGAIGDVERSVAAIEDGQMVEPDVAHAVRVDGVAGGTALTVSLDGEVLNDDVAAAHRTRPRGRVIGGGVGIATARRHACCLEFVGVVACRGIAAAVADGD